MIEFILGAAVGFTAALIPPVRSRVFAWASTAWQYARNAYASNRSNS